MSRRSSKTTTSAATGLLLVYEVRIGDGCKTLFVAVRQHTPKFTPSLDHSARNDQRCGPQVDETDFTTFGDSPAMPQLSWEAGLPSV